jgi:5' nucleotidase, deoxy (Pyrimidine), cytosolic type C protein (NT5C)
MLPGGATGGQSTVVLRSTRCAFPRAEFIHVPLRIAFDLDGVLADMESELARQAARLFGAAMDAGASAARSADGPPADGSTPSTLSLTARQQRRLWRHVESIPDFWLTLDELEPGTVARLAAVAHQAQWEVIFLTTRPATAGATVQRQTQRWLESKGYELPSVFVVRGSRGKVAAALELDVVVDDRPANCLDVVVDSKARAILVFRHPTNQLPAAAQRLGIGVVPTMSACLDLLVRADAEGHDEPSVIDRVRRVLGLKQPATT